MSGVSNLVKNKLQGIVDADKDYHMSKRPQDKIIIEDVAGGWYDAIDKLKEERKGNK